VVVFVSAVALATGCGRTELSGRGGAGPWSEDAGGGGGGGVDGGGGGGADVGEVDAGGPDAGEEDAGGPDDPTCRDEIQNGAETDVDCGGPECNPCRDGATCGGDRDCVSGECVDGRCTTVDPGLGLGEDCERSEQCASGLCGSEVGAQPICTVACGPGVRCGGGLTCFDEVGVCVTNDYCESADGVGNGPGCEGSVCDQCSPDASCELGADGQRVCVCADGYEGDGFDCRDVDECADPLSCPVGATCVNTDGGFECDCPAGFRRVGDACQDVDECREGTDGCVAPATCQNTPGAFECACPMGYTANGQGCDDVDECADPNLNTCDEDATCTNTDGAFECDCDMGYQGDGFSCQDIDECAVPSACPVGETCINLDGSFSCSCPQGFVDQGGVCVDVDECADPAFNQCDANATCTNIPGDYECTCDSGFVGDGRTCQPDSPGLTCANPFDLGPVPASVSGDTSDATNDYERPQGACPSVTQRRGAGSRDEAYSFTPTQAGTYRLRLTTQGFWAPAAYVIGDCADVTGTCLGSDTFDVEFSIALSAGATYYIVVDGAFNQADSSGPYTLDVDLDECATTPDICGAGATCEDTYTGYDCVCQDGYAFVNGACVDVDECATGANDCSANATCANTDGGFTCTCNPPFAGDGVTCSDPNAPGETCDVPFAIATIPFVASNDTSVGAANDYSVPANGCPGATMTFGAGAGGPDQVYSFTPTATGNYRFDVNAGVQGIPWSPAVYIVTACGDVAGTCVAGERTFNNGTSVGVTAALTAGTTYYVIVDGAFNSRDESGFYSFTAIQIP
jgi:hypothetical protein